MYQKLKNTLLIFGIIGVLSISAKASAKMRPMVMDVDLKKGLKVEVDMDDDGTKDLIEIKTSRESDDTGKYVYLTLYYNGDVASTFLSRFYEVPTVIITDLDDKDKSKELFIGDEFAGMMSVKEVMQIGDGKIESIAEESRDGKVPFDSWDSGADIKAVGDGTLVYESVGYSNLGNYFYNSKYQLKDGVIKYFGNRKVKRCTNEWKNDRPYTLDAKLDIYNKYKGKKKKFTLKKGDVFNLLLVKYEKMSLDNDSYFHDYQKPWCKIKTKDGRTGWIKQSAVVKYHTPEGEGFSYTWN